MLRSSMALLVLAVVLPWAAWADGPTSIYINQVPEYDLLESCAETQLSTIVRDMAYLCGDGSKLTSYACFCYQSSAKASSMIGKHVSTACPQFPQQNSSALEVFSKYCELGVVQMNPTDSGTTTQTSPATLSTSASPASSTATAPPATSSPAASANDSDSNKSRTVAIACGVAIPLGVIAIAAAAFLLWRNKRKNAVQRQPYEMAQESGGQRAYEVDNKAVVYELRNEQYDLRNELPPPVEMDGNAATSELNGHDEKGEKRAASELGGNDEKRDKR
ncbi:hypothetical protein EJ04DRAFT_550593 [Polyplosphaeria fusca]|uniref:Extracellular membrane protein CFEM domain-containing protein n=1 Tax=Polyplosphaeria fusca TaxID=682080 RepID=A0A9P4R1H5_9PLEO|nr:hypothetical protein EJ04DRAFT_550593 [Polyplosphaeria fusca]